MAKFATDSNWALKLISLEEKVIGHISTGVVEKRRAGFVSPNREIECG
ncbi:MAG: hypothetical protein ACI8PD_000796 [Nitrospinales bacterium]|jgi:hypothetical protein